MKRCRHCKHLYKPTPRIKVSIWGSDDGHACKKCAQKIVKELFGEIKEGID